MRTISILGLCLVGCAQPADQLELDQQPEHITGSFARAGATVDYDAWSRGPEQASLDLNVNGVAIEVELDMADGILLQDGHGHALQRVDTEALLALRDALYDEDPTLMDSLPGELLVRHLDRLAEAPPGLVVAQHDTRLDLQPRMLRSATCGDDGVTCLAGTNGTATAYYQPDGGSCTSVSNLSYGEDQSWCRGRCGAGCPGWWFSDDDYTQDCFDHDTCVDELNAGNFFWDSDCGDEFWEADDDYFSTYADACPD